MPVLKEVEIKALLTEDLSSFRRKAEKAGFQYQREEAQLNHYFRVTEEFELATFVDEYNLSSDVLKAKSVAIRTREISSPNLNSVTGDSLFNTKTLLVVKYVLDGEDVQNGKDRYEIEIDCTENITHVDSALIKYGLEYRSLWSRERLTYFHPEKEITLCLDKNAGYGYLVELERMVSEEKREDSFKELCDTLEFLGLDMLESNLLETMFKYYETHYEDYYGTEHLIWNSPNWIKFMSNRLFKSN